MYLKKQGELLEGKVSLVKIDLLPAGMNVLSIPMRKIPFPYRTPYRVVVRRGWKRRRRSCMPSPCASRCRPSGSARKTNSDVALDLKHLNQAYDNGGYENDVDYEVKPDPTLEPDEAAWADALLRGKGLRQRPSRPPPPGERKGRNKPLRVMQPYAR